MSETDSQGQPNDSRRKEEALLRLMATTGFQMVQENGQRKYGPPPNWVGPPPAKGCEVLTLLSFI